MNAVDFDKKVKETFLKYFPNGFITSTRYALGGGIHWTTGLIGEDKDIVSFIRKNDVLQLSFGIHDNVQYGSTEEIQGKIVVEFAHNNFKTLPDQPHYAMKSTKIPVRKINNTPEKVIVALDKYFKLTLEMIKAEAANNNLHGQDRIPKKYLEL